MSTLVQATRPGEFLITENDGTLSRTNGILAVSQTIPVGGLLGQITKGAITSTALIGTGNGTCTALSRTANTQVGVYTLRCIAAAVNNGTFAVFDPLGRRLNDAVLSGGSVVYTGQINFTITDGATDFVVGDTFNVTVAAGSGQYALYNPSATDGSEWFAGIAYDAVTTGAGATAPVVVIDFSAEVLRTSLNFGSLTTPQQNAVIAQMLGKFIKVREALG